MSMTSLLTRARALILACLLPALTTLLPATDGPSFKRGVNISHWLAQHAPGAYATPERFSPADAAWIAEHGFDHVRIPIDGRILMSIEGELIEELLQPLDRALEWCEANGLSVILDMHYLPGNEFLNEPEDNALWSDPELRAAAASLWTQIAEKYRDVGPWLRYEVLNEAVAPNHEDLNILNALIVRAIRDVDEDRVIYVSSNRWGQFQTVPDLRLFDDPNVHYALHTYEPFIFTHQSASWTPLRDVEPGSVPFPGTYDIPADTEVGAAMIEELGAEQMVLNRTFLTDHYRPVMEWARANDVQVVITEFGAYRAADPQSVTNFIRANVELCEEAGFGWTVWDYKGGFAVRGEDGEPTAVYRGLFPGR